MKDSLLKFCAVRKAEREAFLVETSEKRNVLEVMHASNQEFKNNRVDWSLSLDLEGSEVIVQIGEADLTRNLIRNALGPNRWLSSEITNAYFILLKQRENQEAAGAIHKCHFFDTFFFPKIKAEVGTKHIYWSRFVPYSIFDCRQGHSTYAH